MSRTFHRQANQLLALDSILMTRVCTTSAADGTVEGREPPEGPRGRQSLSSEVSALGMVEVNGVAHRQLLPLASWPALPLWCLSALPYQLTSSTAHIVEHYGEPQGSTAFS